MERKGHGLLIRGSRKGVSGCLPSSRFTVEGVFMTESPREGKVD